MPDYDYDTYASGYAQQAYQQHGYDEQGNYIAYDLHGYQQGYYDENGNFAQGYDQQAYQAQGYYDENGQYVQGNYARKEIEPVRDVFGQMPGEGSTYATDAEDSPHLEQTREQQPPLAKPRLYERVIAALKHWLKSS